MAVDRFYRHPSVRRWLRRRCHRQRDPGPSGRRQCGRRGQRRQGRRHVATMPRATTAVQRSPDFGGEARARSELLKAMGQNQRHCCRGAWHRCDMAPALASLAVPSTLAPPRRPRIALLMTSAAQPPAHRWMSIESVDSHQWPLRCMNICHMFLHVLQFVG